MATNKFFSPEQNDSFSDLPQVNNESIQNSVEKPSQSTDTVKNKLDTKSGGYAVKKITSSLSHTNKTIQSDTGINTISIDTDSFNKTDDSKNEDQILSQTSIETGEFSQISSSKPQSYPLIIDETDQYDQHKNSTIQSSQIKKERPLLQQNISIDISSEFCNPSLPSEKNEDELGSGKVVCALGSGGMAKVYKIWNEKLEIYRAVKVLSPTNQKEHWNRFLTEAKITVKLHHPNIIETYDTGEWHGLPIIEMELIEGDTLNTLIEMHPMIPSPVCASIALQVSKALEYAHSQQIMIYGKMYNGIIHRDLKPSNIMVTSKGIVKLMDFGVARPIETGLHTIATDSLVGTIHYFSPEQINGYPIDQLSDVYSFGAVLYEIICGSNPFPHSNMVNMIQAKTKNQFKRLEEYYMKIDNRLSSVAQTCMRTEKRQRFSNFDQIKKVLEDIQSSYNMGTPEEIIAAFYKNPQKIQYDFEQLFISSNQQQPPTTAPAVQTDAVGENSAKYTTAQDPIQQKKIITDSEQQLWESKTPSKIITLIISVIFIIILGVSGFIFIKNNNKNNLQPVITEIQIEQVSDKPEIKPEKNIKKQASAIKPVKLKKINK